MKRRRRGLAAAVRGDGKALGEHATNTFIGVVALSRIKGCFVAGTEVWTLDGPRPIEAIQVGDWVLSMSETGEGDPVWRQVTTTFEREPSSILDVGSATLQAT